MDNINDKIDNCLSDKYIIIEPHSDDAVLSSGELILKKKPTCIVTVFSGKNKDVGTKKLTKDLEIDYFNMDFPDIDLKEKKVMFKTDILISTLKKIIEKEKYNDGDKRFIVSTIGGYHPAHSFINNVLVNMCNEKCIFARDFPHSYKSSSFLNKNFKLQFSVDSMFDEKIKIFKKYYKTQRGLLFFNKKYFDLKPKEEYYTYKETWW